MLCRYKWHACRLTCTDKFPNVPTKLRKGIIGGGGPLATLVFSGRLKYTQMMLRQPDNDNYYPYQTSEQVISFMVLPSLSMPERPRWEYILYFPWSRLSYWLCVLTNAGNITLVFCPVLHPGTCGHRRRQKIWKSPHRTNFSQSYEKSHKFAREKWEEGRLSHWRAR